MNPRFFKYLYTLVLFSGCYYWDLVKLQWNIEKRRIPLEKALQDSRISNEQKEKIRLIQKSLTFAEKILGYRVKKAYRDWVFWDRDYLVINVVASPNWRIEAYTWSYPFLGKLPYRGFTRIENAQAEAQRLTHLGYDTQLIPVTAFSTLGFLSDPVMSYFTQFEDWVLTELIFHELTHIQAYWSNAGDFNETWAQFMAIWANLLFWKSENKSKLTLLETAVHQNGAKFCFVSETLRQLEDWYNRTPPDAKLKAEKFDQIRENCRKRGLPTHFCQRWENNASFISYVTYDLKLPFFWEKAIQLQWSPVQWVKEFSQASQEKQNEWLSDWKKWETPLNNCEGLFQEHFKNFLDWSLR